MRDGAIYLLAVQEVPNFAVLRDRKLIRLLSFSLVFDESARLFPDVIGTRGGKLQRYADGYFAKQTRISTICRQNHITFQLTIFTSFRSLIFGRVSDSKIFVCNLLFLGCNLFEEGDLTAGAHTSNIEDRAYARSAISDSFHSLVSITFIIYSELLVWSDSP